MSIVDRREFLTRVGWGAATTAVAVGSRKVHAATPSKYPDWIPASPKPPKRGGTLTRASAWDPPVIDPRLTQSIELAALAGVDFPRMQLEWQP